MNPHPGKQPFWLPHTDVFATDSCLIVLVELAGMRKEDLELIVEGRRLGIRGDRLHPCPGDRVGTTDLINEIKFGSFETVIEVPPGYDTTRAKANYHNGFLRIDVPEQLQARFRT